MPSKKRQSAVANIHDASDEYKKKLRFRKPKPQPPLPMLSKKQRQLYTVKTPYPQSYSYPSTIITYIARNPANLNDHKKLIKSAKSLLRASRIIPVEEVFYCEDDGNIWMADDEIFNLNNRSFDMWITSELIIRTPTNPYFASTLLKRIYRCDLECLELHHQILTLNELKFFTSGNDLARIEFTESIFKNDVDGSVAEFEKVFEILLNAKNFEVTLPSEQHGIGNETARKIVEMLENEKVPHSIELENIPESFQFATFSCFLQTNLTGNQRIKQKMDLSFSVSISQTFKNQLQTFVHEIIAIVEQNFSLIGDYVPLINFSGQDEAAYLKLQHMRQMYRPAARMSTGGVPPSRRL